MFKYLQNERHTSCFRCLFVNDASMLILACDCLWHVFLKDEYQTVELLSHRACIFNFTRYHKIIL